MQKKTLSVCNEPADVVSVLVAALAAGSFCRFLGDPVSDWWLVLVSLVPFGVLAICARLLRSTRFAGAIRPVAVAFALCHAVLFLWCRLGGREPLDDDSDRIVFMLAVLAVVLPLQLLACFAIAMVAVVEHRKK